MSVLALSFVIPNAPGNIGIFEWVSIFVLTRFGFGREQALSLGLIVHAVQFVTAATAGMTVYCYYKSRLAKRLRQVKAGRTPGAVPENYNFFE